MEIVFTCNILYYKDSNSQTLHIQSQSAQLSKGCAQHALTPSPELLVVVLPLFTQKKLRRKSGRDKTTEAHKVFNAFIH